MTTATETQDVLHQADDHRPPSMRRYRELLLIGARADDDEVARLAAQLGRSDVQRDRRAVRRVAAAQRIEGKRRNMLQQIRTLTSTAREARQKHNDHMLALAQKFHQAVRHREALERQLLELTRKRRRLGIDQIMNDNADLLADE